MTAKEPKAIPVRWPSDVSDVPTHYSNFFSISHAGPEFYLIFGEVTPPPHGAELPDVIYVRPCVKIAVTPEVMLSIARAIEDNVEKYRARTEQQTEAE